MQQINRLWTLSIRLYLEELGEFKAVEANSSLERTKQLYSTGSDDCILSFRVILDTMPSILNDEATTASTRGFIRGADKLASRMNFFEV